MSKFDYVLGFLAADGWVRIDKHRRACSAHLEVKDEQIISDIADMFQKDYRYRSRVIAGKQRNFYSITLSRTELSGFIDAYRPGRTGIKNVYDSCENKNDFIRGLFDGDGSVARVPSTSGLRINFSINSLCVEIIEVLDNYCAENKLHLSKYFDKRGNGAWCNSINRQSDVRKFFELIYKNSNGMFLKRKYDVFISHGFPNLVTD